MLYPILQYKSFNFICPQPIHIWPLKYLPFNEFTCNTHMVGRHCKYILRSFWGYCSLLFHALLGGEKRCCSGCILLYVPLVHFSFPLQLSLFDKSLSGSENKVLICCYFIVYSSCSTFNFVIKVSLFEQVY